MISRFFAAAFCFFFIAGAATAEVSQREWTPWEEDPTCLVSENYFTTPDAKNRMATAQGMILQWYVWGDAFFSNVSRSDLQAFSECFMEFAGAPDCGLPKNSAIKDIIVGLQRGREFVPGDVAHIYFSAPPPPEAIKFAARGVGRCFGNDSEGFSLEELGLVRVDTPVEACNETSLKIQSPFMQVPPYEIDRGFAQIPAVAAWSRIVSNLIGYKAVAPSKPVEVCSVAPKQLADILGGMAVHTKVIADKAAAESEAERVRLTNRTDEERFGGLNGCQIAYSLVYQGINAREKTVGIVPDEALGWAFDYEDANLNGKACPVIPQGLSDWVQKQPMATFQAEPDPYTSFRARNGAGYRASYEDWLNFAKIWMSRYDTQIARTDRAGGDCDAVLYYARSDVFSAANEDNGPSAFATLVRLDYGADAETAMCQFAPVSIFESARAAYNAEETRKREQVEREMRLQNPINPANLPRQNYLWKNTPSTRCYVTGYSQSGLANQSCFTN